MTDLRPAAAAVCGQARWPGRVDLRADATPGWASSQKIAYGYDRQGFQVSEQLPGQGPVVWEVDGSGARVGEVSPSGRERTWVRDGLGRVTGDVVDLGGVVSARWFGYDGAGRQEWQRIWSSAAPSGAKQLWRQEVGYSADGDVDRVRTLFGDAEIVDEVGYDDAGRIDVLARSFDADVSDPLVVPEVASVDYTWNGRGDRTGVVVSGTQPASVLSPEALGVPGDGTFGWAFSSSGRLVSGPGGVTYDYDDDGRMLREKRPSEPDTRYSYDPRGDLVAVEVADGAGWVGQHAVQRDVLGRVTEMTAGSTVTGYLPGGLGSDPVTSSVGSSDTTLVRGPGGGLLSTVGSGGAYRVGVSHHNDVSVSVAVDGAQSVESGSVYGPFGGRVSWGSDGTGLGFQGQPHDPDAEIVHTPARAYHTGHGRFLQADVWQGDTSNPVTLNRYTYANANPYTLWDPTGLFGVPTWAKKAWDNTGGKVATATNNHVVKPLAGGAERHTRGARGWVGGGLSRGKDAVEGFFGTVGDGWTATWDWTSDRVDDVGSAIGDGGSAVWGWGSDRVNDVGSVAGAVGDGLGAAGGWLSDNADDIFKYGASAIAGTACFAGATALTGGNVFAGGAAAGVCGGAVYRGIDTAQQGGSLSDVLSSALDPNAMAFDALLGVGTAGAGRYLGNTTPGRFVRTEATRRFGGSAGPSVANTAAANTNRSAAPATRGAAGPFHVDDVVTSPKPWLRGSSGNAGRIPDSVRTREHATKAQPATATRCRPTTEALSLFDQPAGETPYT